MKKRLLVLNIEFPPLGGGASPVSYELARQLSLTDQYDIDVVTMWYPGLSFYEEVHKSFRIYRVQSGRKKKEMSHPFELVRFVVGAFFVVRRLMQSGSYDLCHTHFIIPTGLLAYLLQKIYKLEYVITAHGSDVLGYNQRFQFLYPLVRWPWKKVLAGARMVTTPSLFLKERILSVYPQFPEQRIAVVPNGIDCTVFIPQPKRPYILSAGRLLPNKGFQYLIEAVSDRDLGWEVHIVGDGPFRDELTALAARSKTKIVFDGWLDNRSQQYRDLVGQASIFVSMSDVESFGMTIVEAMSAGCAVVVRSGSGAAEVVEGSGTVITGDLVKELRYQLDELITNDTKRIDLQTRSVQTAQRYAWPVVTETYATYL